MPRPRNYTHVNLHTLRWKCELHGDHHVIVAGLDSMALTMARVLVEHCSDAQWPCKMTSMSIPLDEARRAAGGQEVTLDDLPF